MPTAPLGFVPVYPTIDGLHFVVKLLSEDESKEYHMVLESTQDQTYFFDSTTCQKYKVNGCFPQTLDEGSTNLRMFFGLDDNGVLVYRYGPHPFIASMHAHTHRRETISAMPQKPLTLDGTLAPELIQVLQGSNPLSISRFNQSHGLISVIARRSKQGGDQTWILGRQGIGIDLYQPRLDPSLTSPEDAIQRLPDPEDSITPSHAEADLFKFGWLPPRSESRLYLEGVPPAFKDKISWQGFNASPSLCLECIFHLYSLRLCGIPIHTLAGQGPLPALVDLAVTGLGLPQPIFDAVMNWIPSLCVTTPFHHCFFTGTLKDDMPTSLPVLSFSLNRPQDASDNPEGAHETLYLPLSQLILPLTYSVGTQHPHLHRLAIFPHAPNFASRVIFGTLPASAFYMHMWTDGEEKTEYNNRICRCTGIGFANKLFFEQQTLNANFSKIVVESNELSPNPKSGVPLRLAINHQCRPPVTCQGMQTRDMLSNRCIDPKCDAYLFFRLNSNTHMCELSPVFYVLASILFALFVLLELFLLWCERRTYPTIMRNAPRYSLANQQQEPQGPLARLIGRLRTLTRGGQERADAETDEDEDEELSPSYPEDDVEERKNDVDDDDARSRRSNSGTAHHSAGSVHSQRNRQRTALARLR